MFVNCPISDEVHFVRISVFRWNFGLRKCARDTEGAERTAPQVAAGGEGRNLE